MPRTTEEPDRRFAPNRTRRVVGLAAAVVLIGGATTACAVAALDRSTPLPDSVDVPAAPVAPPATASGSGYTTVPLEQGVTMWHTPLPDGSAVYFVAERNGDAITTARVGMGGPRCFFGSAQDGVLQGRYRVITAGSGLDRQADPVRVTLEAGTLTLTERATGTRLGQYVAIDPADTESVAAAQAALDSCAAVRAAPATATPS